MNSLDWKKSGKYKPRFIRPGIKSKGESFCFVLSGKKEQTKIMIKQGTHKKFYAIVKIGKMGEVVKHRTVVYVIDNKRQADAYVKKKAVIVHLRFMTGGQFYKGQNDGEKTRSADNFCKGLGYNNFVHLF